MKFVKQHFFLLLIIFLGIVLRFYQLGSNPPSLDWDEASMGYNAYSILHTGKDEYGTFLPLSIRSFDDYKPPVLTYLMIPSIALFGLNEFAVRLPSAIFGSIAIWLTYLIVFGLLQNGEKKREQFIKTTALFASSFLAISPWHIQFSRTAFEANIGLTFFLAGFICLLYGLKNSKWWLISASAFTLSMYSYHSFRLIIPLFLIGFLCLYLREIKKNMYYAILSSILFLLLCLPIAISTVSPGEGASARFGMVTIFGDSAPLQQSIQQLEYAKAHHDTIGEFFANRRFVYLAEIVQGYFSHMNPDYLFFHGDGGRQHHAADMGMLYLWDAPFILVGLYFLFKNPTRKKFLLLLVFLLAPLPSAIATDPPHAVRSIAMIPAFQIFSAVGISSIFFWLQKQKKDLFIGVIGVVCVALFVNVFYYLHQYFVVTPIQYADAWQYGAKQAILYAKQHENEYQHIVMTYRYDQPYVYYLFYNQIDPTWYQHEWINHTSKSYDRMTRNIGKYAFRNIDWEKDSMIKNSLFIGTPSEIPQNAMIKDRILFSNGVTAFLIATS